MCHRKPVQRSFEFHAGRRYRHRPTAQPGTQQHRQSADMIQRQGKQPAVVLPKRDIVIGAERAEIMVGQIMQHPLRPAAAAGGEDDRRRLIRRKRLRNRCRGHWGTGGNQIFQAERFGRIKAGRLRERAGNNPFGTRTVAQQLAHLFGGEAGTERYRHRSAIP